MAVKSVSVKSTITAQFQQVAREQDRTLAPLSWCSQDSIR